jgi:hypothetical protein
MNLAAAAGQAVERINGIPAPLALVLTIAGCVLALGWVLFVILRDGKKEREAIKKG